MQVKIRKCGVGLRLRLYVGSVCDTQRHCSCSMWFVAICKCYAFDFRTSCATKTNKKDCGHHYGKITWCNLWHILDMISNCSCSRYCFFPTSIKLKINYIKLFSCIAKSGSTLCKKSTSHCVLCGAAELVVFVLCVVYCL